METYKYQPHRYASTGVEGMYSDTCFNEECESYPFFDDLDSAIEYATSNKIFGCVQRYATWPAPPPGPEPHDNANFGWWSMWFSDKLDYERGFCAITAGVVWISKNAPVSPMTLFTTKRTETETGTLLKEIPGAFEAICQAQELADEELESDEQNS